MKSFSRVQKKGILSARALENNRLNNSIENFDQMVEKQLEEDFKVHEYLNENPNEGHNSEEYISLFNSLLVKKFNKVKRKQLLKSTKAQWEANDKDHIFSSRSKSQVKGQAIDAYYTEEEYLKIKEDSEARQKIIEEQTEQELEMKRVLLKQITENKKSLNLLKGDIGHMITRNESISVLQSKVNKVSLVSENQLKRVSLALSKDKEQVQLRQQMQKRFHTKLKVVQNLQSRNLKKIKLSYIETMKRRKQIFDNLSLIEKQCASIEEYSDKIKQKQEKNSKTLARFRLLNFMIQAIKRCQTLWSQFQNKQINSNLYCKKLKSIFNFSITPRNSQAHGSFINVEQITPQKLDCLKFIIVSEFQRLQSEIQQKKKVYKQHMARIEQKWTKIGQCDQKQHQIIEEFNKQQRIMLGNQRFSLSDYFTTFHRLKSNQNILYFLIDFFQRKFASFTGKQLINSLYENECFHLKIQQRQQESYTFNQLFFGQLQSKFKTLFVSLRQKLHIWLALPQNLRQEWLAKNLNRQQITPDWCTERECQNLSQNNQNQDYEDQQNSDQQDDHYYKRPMNELNYEEQKSMGRGTKTTTCQSKHTNEEEVAKRIQILTKIDQSYYRMIKETIEMEKENTMKNYQFQRSFKRNKYSSQDELLQQKRFEASFSNLFKQDPDQLPQAPKLKHQSFKIKKTMNKSAFSSVHNANSKVFQPASTATSLKKSATTFWQKQKRIRLRGKLADVLSRT